MRPRQLGGLGAPHTDDPFNTTSVLAFGQSNMSANQFAMMAPGPFPQAIAEENWAIRTYRNDVVAQAKADLPPGFNDDGIGQVCGRFCRLVLDGTDADRVWCLNRSAGSLSITALLPGETLYDECKVDVAALELAPLYVLWSQGEQDHDKTEAFWHDHFVTFSTTIAADYPTVTDIFLFKTAAGANGNDLTTVRDAQDAVASEIAMVTLISMDDLTSDTVGPDRSYDGLHYNFNGYSLFADRAFAAV